MKFLSPDIALFCINLPYDHVWNTVIISGLVLLAATWKFLSYKNRLPDRLYDFSVTIRRCYSDVYVECFVSLHS